MPQNTPTNYPLLIIGAKGQLGQALMSQAPNAVGVSRETVDLSAPDLDIQILDCFNTKGPFSGVINAAAYTAVDRAETELKLASQVNGTAPGIIASFCAKQSIPLIHISTDYVFAGQSTKPYQPDDKAAPLNAYGQSKYEGEIEIRKTAAIAAILRTSWVYDSTNGNFLTTMVRLGKERDMLSVVSDQIGRPTFTGDLAAAALQALKVLQLDETKAGIYHVSNVGDAISWADFATAIFEAANLNTIVKPISTEEYPTPAKRPAYSVMDTSKFESSFDHDLPDWREGLRHALSQSERSKA